MTTADKPSSDEQPFIGPRDIPHATSHQVVKDILQGKITRPARDQLRDALDKADKPPTGRNADGSHRPPPGKAFRQ